MCDVCDRVRGLVRPSRLGSTAKYVDAARELRAGMGRYRRRASVLGVDRDLHGADDEGRRGRRAERYRLQTAAAALLPGERVAHCMHTAGVAGVEVVVNGDGVASYRGLQTCGSVWSCPVCSAKISGVRRSELNALLAWARGMGYVPALVTLTFRHSRGMALRDSLGVLKNAFRRLRQSRRWSKKIAAGVVGTVAATEITHGVNGWHPHIHWLVICGSPESYADLPALRGVWERSLRAEGSDCNDYGYMVQGAASAGDYVAKWGAAEEVSLVGRKKGRAGGSHPWQLLARYLDGDQQAGALYVEYAQAMRGRRQLVWSDGLKAAVGIVDRADSEIIADGDQDRELVTVARLPGWLWLRVVRRGFRAAVLDAAETGTLDRLLIRLSG